MRLANLQPFLAIFYQLHKHFSQNLGADGHFSTICGHFFGNYLHRYLSQNLGADGHFEGLNVSNSQLNQNL